MAAAASFTAEAVAWWKRNFSGSSSAFGSAAALWVVINDCSFVVGEGEINHVLI